MSEEDDAPESTGNPLAGVLDRLLGRERGERRAEGPGRPAAASERGAEVRGSPRPRRMIPFASLGDGLASEALRSAAQWAVLLGRRPVAMELGCGPPASRAAGAEGRASDAENGIPLVRVPCDLDRVRREPAEVVLALLGLLREQEQAADLCLVRIPLCERKTLMRAAFLSGVLVLPLEEQQGLLREAVDLARDAVRSFLEVSVWLYARRPAETDCFLDLVPPEVRARAKPFDPGRLDISTELERLREPPREGFLVGLLAPEPAFLPPELLQLDSLPL